MDIGKYESGIRNTQECSRLTADVYFLIQRFLSSGPLKRTLQTLNEELHEHKILPKRIDWQGEEHDRSIEDMQNQYPHIHKDFLQFLCAQASTFLNPNTSVVPSYLSFRPKAKTKDGVYSNFKQYFNYVARIHGAPIHELKSSFNIVNSIRGRQIGGAISRQRTYTPRLYKGMQVQRTTIGHLSAVYCLLFDHSGRFIITGADDLLIKMWATYTGRLVAVFRGASSEITDIAIDAENTLLAAGSIDRILRVWSLQTGSPIAVLTGHTGMITSVNFCPTPCWGTRYLISTSTDGSIAFYGYQADSSDKFEFRNTPTVYQEKMRPGQAQMICSSFSPGGTFLATGSADHHVRVYHMKGDEGPQRILETAAHTDRVDSIQWGHSGLKFLSGSKDGTANVWWFERQQWKSVHLDMSAKLPDDKQTSESDTKKGIRVTMVAFDKSDTSVVTAVSDHTMKVWNASTGQLVRILTGHTDEVYVLEPHPHDEDVILSTGHDGQLLIWDIHKGEILFKFTNTIEGQGFGAIFDAKWSPDGCTIAASDSHGDILTFGFGTGSPFYQQLPKELFFHTDYRPLVRDQNYWVLDEQTQIPPHLMPPPFLVDIDGNPYPPMLQRLVPGREHCNVEHLVPNIVIGNEGIQEIIQEVPNHHRALEDLLEEEDVRGSAGGSMRIQRIRQSTGDWQTDHTIEWKKTLLVPPLPASVLQRLREIRRVHEDLETKEYQKQLRKRPLMISTAGPSTAKAKDKKKRITKNPKKSKPFTPIEELDPNKYDVVPLSPEEYDESSFSDWAEEVSEPRKRRAKRRNNYSDSTSSDNEDSSLDVTSQSDESDDDDDVVDRSRERREKKRNHRAAREKSRRNSPKPSTSKHVAGPSRASVPKNPVIPKKDPQPKTGQTASKSNPAEPSTSGVTKGPKIKISEQYKLSEWLAETRPRKSPYYPQIHDEIVYFVQGHILYIEAVKQKSVYEPNIKELPWVKGMQLKDHEFCKVIGIRYEIKPPRLCCLKLALQDQTGRATGKTFTVKYHDMPDVLDFFVLKQSFLAASSRDWREGDKFRCMIDDNWWIGEVTNKSPASDLYPDSTFMCYEIQWTNGEQERMSPWDMEQIDEERVPEDEKAAIPVLANELRAILYKPTPGDWPNCERDTACKSIARGITQVMELAIAEPFLVPVDINVYPTYALIVEYPIDLSTIKARFENNFYRRMAAAQYDIRYLETNAIKFNEKGSIIVKHAKILTELCLKIVKSGNNAIDIASVYHQLVNGYDTSNSEEEVNVEDLEQPSTSRAVRHLPVRSWKSPDDWKIEASGLLELIWQTEDSVPFRDPVNKFKYPTYYQVIKHPMDLSVVKDKLQKSMYTEPKEFCSDMRLMFQNSRTFNTNKRSRIYVMTVRLSAMFEEHMKKITTNWRIAKKRKRHLSTTTEDSDSDQSNVAPSQSQMTSPASETVKVIVEPIESLENGNYGSDNSEDTPLGALLPIQEDPLPVIENGFLPEASTSSQSQSIDDFDHNYTNQRMGLHRKRVKEEVKTENDRLQGVADEEEESSSDSDEPLSFHQTKGKKLIATKESSSSSSSEEEFVPEDTSGSSSKSGRRRKKSSSDEEFVVNKRARRRKRASSFVVEEDDDEEEEEMEESSDGSSSDDDVPLKPAPPSRRVRRRTRKSNSDSSSESSSDSNQPKPKRKRRKVLLSESRDSDQDARVSRREDSSGYFGNVSSRGRVRKITERAAAFLKKSG
ncbi:bromodomain and WD repeat-containing protein 3 [Anthonomus grandis grandis]|uniref:bromodomain and WD repeat-containing protein 3 n=1 Tax=Anthonomus grandis grandis TaxID=2921223 RepID=UPI002165EB9F|nr:bromodomain and WD repeat-containing protein 3 [Anthonomus grandis grandis]